MKKVLGIIGGIGPKTSSKFHMDLIRRGRKELGVQPRILMAIAPVSEDEEARIIQGEPELLLPHLIECLERLNKADVSAIVITSNTGHLFLKKLERISKAPIINIIDENIKEIKKRRISKIGLLATESSINLNLFQPRFNEEDIKFFVPVESEQKELSGALGNMLKRGNPLNEERNVMNRLIESMANRGAEAVILACTDLQFLAPKKARIPIIDSLKVLENASFELIKSCNSSTAERSAVNRGVAGASPACGTRGSNENE